MSYVDNNLMRDESVLYKAKVHWLIFLWPAIMFVLMVYLFSTHTLENRRVVVGVMILPFALFFLVNALITRASTELAVTNKRVIAKFGFIRRSTIELYLLPLTEN